jgi:hypothetical protein
MQMILQKYRRQFSDKAIAVDHGGQPFFIPNTFEHYILENELVEIDIPSWFLDKHRDALQQIERNTNLLIERLCDQG